MGISKLWRDWSMSKARFAKGEEITFTAAKGGRRFKAVVVEPKIVRGNIAIQLQGDPYPVTVKVAQISKENENVPVSEARKLRKDAEALGIKGITKMNGKDLAAAVEAAKNPPKKTAAPIAASAAGAVKTYKENEKALMTGLKTKKKPAAKKTAPAKKAVKKPVVAKKATKKAVPAKVAKKTPPSQAAKKAPPTKKVTSDTNPFRPGSNLAKMTDELLKGGRRVEMIRRLKKTMGIHPWSKDKEENPEKAIDKRLLITAGTLKKDYGYTIETEGRGSSGTIKVLPPGAKKKATGQTAKKKPSSKKTTQKTARR